MKRVSERIHIKLEQPRSDFLHRDSGRTRKGEGGGQENGEREREGGRTSEESGRAERPKEWENERAGLTG
jgi:hypothetical protein